MQKIEAELAKAVQEVYKIQMAMTGVTHSIKDMRAQNDKYYQEMQQHMEVHNKVLAEQRHYIYKTLSEVYKLKDK